jgi:hypothetical protein
MNAHHATPIDFTRLRRSLLRSVRAFTEKNPPDRLAAFSDLSPFISSEAHSFAT